MSEKQRLMATLVENKEKKLLNVKFFRPDGSRAVSEEEFCARINKMIFAIDMGLSDASARFDGDTQIALDVNEVARRLA